MYRYNAIPWIVLYYPGFIILGKPIFWWLSISRSDWRPTIAGEASSMAISEDGPYRSYWNLGVCLPMLAFMQFFHCLGYIIWVLLSLPYLVPLAIFGIYLFQCKVMSVGHVWNFFFRLWSGSQHPAANKTVAVDTGVLNLSMFSHLMNTVPQFVVQISNNTVTELWTPIGCTSKLQFVH